METKTGISISFDNLSHLPRFAAYLLNQKSDAFVHKQIEYSFELNIQVLKFFLSMPEEQRFELSRQGTTAVLTCLSSNKDAGQCIQQWKTNLFSGFSNDVISVEDITQITYMLKKAMLHFIPGYTANVSEIIELVKEIDFFILRFYTGHNTTEKQLLIDRLRKSETLYKQAEEIANMGNWSWDVKANKLEWTDQLYRIYGLDPQCEEITIERFLSFVHPDDREYVQHGVEELNIEKFLDYTFRIVTGDGTEKWLRSRAQVLRNDKGEAQHIIGIEQDVSEQKEASETIREQEYFIQQIADASPTILYLFDVPSQSIAYINREAFFVLGYLPDEIIDEGSNITSLLYHPDDMELLPARYQSQKTFRQIDSMIQYECRMKHKDDDYRWLLVREIVFKTDDKENITQIIGAALDITRRKEMEKTILQNAHQLEQSNASLEEFAYVASHDLKEPLRKISMFGDRLVASHIDKLGDDGRIYLHKIVDASQRMENMISDLLSISMISGNYSFETINLQKILEEVLQTLEFKIEQQDAIVRYDVLPEANVIPSQFRQLFQNLIANSLKFVREDVQPVIVISCTAPTEDEINNYGLAKASSYLKLAFSDNGIGFEAEYAQKIFAMFQRLHGRSEYEGSGIGLSICKKIVEHHGGVIFARSLLNQGATFTIIIPE